MFPSSPHNYCSSKLTSAPLFGSARSHTHTIPRPSATGSPKHRWRQRYGAGSLLVGSTTCSARIVLRWPAWARSTANCNNAQKNPRSCSQRASYFRIGCDQRGGQTWPRPTVRCTERVLVSTLHMSNPPRTSTLCQVPQSGL